MNIYLLRHGMTQGNLERRYIGRTDEPLCEQEMCIRDRANPVGEVLCHERVLFLTGGRWRAQDICRELVNWKLGQCKIWVGERLSYPEERITAGRAQELACLLYTSRHGKDEPAPFGTGRGKDAGGSSDVFK